MREQVRDKLQQIVQEEVLLALGAGRYQRVGEERQGYLNGTRRRTLTTSLGPTTFDMPRARLKVEEGGTTEWSSRIMPRYQRRTQRIDEAILGVYLSGSNTRRIRGALAPLLKGWAPIQGYRVSIGQSAERGLQCLATTGSAAGGYPLHLYGWLVSQGSHW